ncbi:MAG: HNH endonuclease [Phycisphaerae bacterium]|nr:HNH endonuclease [Phycisphaerae bacterium]
MHREIMKARKELVVDHKNCRTWDNRRCNLRVCTQKQNQVNRGPCRASSQYVGVYPRGKKYEARIVYRGRPLYLGRYDTPIAAAKARDRKAYELHGPFAYLNFPKERGR